MWSISDTGSLHTGGTETGAADETDGDLRKER